MHSTLEVIDSTNLDVFDLVDLATLKAELNITVDTEDATLSAGITRWSKIIAEDIARVLALQDVVETFRFDRHPWRGSCPNRETALRLGRAPVETIWDVTIDGTVVDSEDIDVDKDAGSLWIRKHGWWMCKVVVRYTAGFDLPSGAPAKLQQACIQAVREARHISLHGMRDIHLLSSGEDTARYFPVTDLTTAGALSKSVSEMIEPYRRLLL